MKIKYLTFVIELKELTITKLTAENVAASSEQANLASKKDIVNFLKKADFVGKLKNLNKKASSNKSNIY